MGGNAIPPSDQYLIAVPIWRTSFVKPIELQNLSEALNLQKQVKALLHFIRRPSAPPAS